MPAETPAARPSPRRLPLMRSLSAVIAAGLVGPASAVADTRTATSPVTGMEAVMTGPRITVAPGPKASGAFLRSVQGRPVTVACLNGAEALIGVLEEGGVVPTGDFDVAFLGGPAPWPAGGTSLTHALTRDVSATVDGCVVGRAMAVASTFGFSALGRAALEEGVDQQSLAVAHHAAKFVARDAADSRFPGARRLTAEIAESEPQLRIAYAPTVRQATRNDVVYVIGRGTDFRSVSLSYRRNDGQPARLEGRRRGEPTVSVPDESDVPMPPPDDAARRLPRRS